MTHETYKPTGDSFGLLPVPAGQSDQLHADELRLKACHSEVDSIHRRPPDFTTLAPIRKVSATSWFGCRCYTVPQLPGLLGCHHIIFSVTIEIAEGQLVQ
jgi:hypothetical protein